MEQYGFGESEPSVTDELSGNTLKIYKTMKELGMTSEVKMGTMERITQNSKIPKGMVQGALQDLMNKGFAARKVREKAAGYYLLK